MDNPPGMTAWLIKLFWVYFAQDDLKPCQTIKISKDGTTLLVSVDWTKFRVTLARMKFNSTFGIL